MLRTYTPHSAVQPQPLPTTPTPRLSLATRVALPFRADAPLRRSLYIQLCPQFFLRNPPFATMRLTHTSRACVPEPMSRPARCRQMLQERTDDDKEQMRPRGKPGWPVHRPRQLFVSERSSRVDAGAPPSRRDGGTTSPSPPRFLRNIPHAPESCSSAYS